MNKFLIVCSTGVFLAAGSVGLLHAQDTDRDRPAAQSDAPGRPGGPGGGPGGPGGFRGGFGGPGGPGGRDLEVVKQFDKDNDGRLNADERKAAREFLKTRPVGRGGRGGPGGFGRGGFGPGVMLAPAILSEADKDNNRQVSKDEFRALADAWFDQLDADKAGRLSEEQFGERISNVLPRPQGFGGGRGGGPGGGGGRGGFAPGRMMGAALFGAADANKDASLTRDEWKSNFAKWFDQWDGDKGASLSEDELRDGLNNALPRPQGPGGGFGGGFGRGGNREPAKPGPRVSPADVKNHPDAPLYEPTVLRTLFLDFEGGDWETELSEFRNTDVEVPATLTVDGKKYPGVGVRFRGASSLMGVPDGYKRSLNLAVDFTDGKQKLYGYKTLNLLNANDDPTFLHTVLYFDVARRYIAAPKANLVKVVINGESWGVYVNAQQFNKDFINEWFANDQGARWKVQGSPGGRGGLEYLGEDVEAYKRLYQIKSRDVPQAWKDLIRLCKTLKETPPEKLEEALKPVLDVDGALWFLALENAFINSDGYWVRASDYCIYQDTTGKFHVIPHDANETFAPGMGPGMGGRGGRGGPGRGGPGGGPGGQGGRGGPGGDVARADAPAPGGPQPDADGPLIIPLPGPGGRGPGGGGDGVRLDPLVGLDDPTKPLRSKLLAVPALRQRYLEHVRTLATDWLDWQKLSPLVQQYRSLIEAEVAADTRKLSSTEEFARAIDGGAEAPPAAEGGARPGRGRLSLREFAEQRRKFLLESEPIKNLNAPAGGNAAAAPAATSAPAPQTLAPAAPAPAKESAALPQKPEELFQETKVWDIHLTFTPEQFAAMEPEGGPGAAGGPGFGGRGRGPGGPGGPGGPRPAFGPGMFLGPAFANAGDTDGDRKLSRDELRGLGKWFAVWDNANAGKVNPDQLRDGLNATFSAPGPGGRPGRGGPGISLQGREGSRNGLAAAMGIEFKYVHADLQFQGQPFKDVGVRYKGNGTFLQSRSSLKRSLKIDLDEFTKNPDIAGVSKLNLHNGVTDASHMNEVLSHRLFRDAGVPAPRTAYARVYLTVPGRHDRQYLGLYSLVENVDGDFAEERFGTKGGTILKPVTPVPFTDLGDDWAKYKQSYDPKDDMPADDQQRVMEFCKLVSHADDATFNAKVADYVDLDNFSRFMAVTVWLSTMDSILGPGQNYYVHLHPQTKKLQFIPWDLDHSFGQFFLMGSQEQRERLTIHKPWQGDNRFLDRVFKHEPFKKLYLARLEEFSKTIFQPQRFGEQVDAIAAAVRPAVEAESRTRLERFDKVVAGEPVGPEMGGFGPPGGPGGRGPGGGGGPGGPGGPPPGFPAMAPAKPIKGFVTARAQSVLDQLAGKSEGETIQGFGPMGGGRGPGGGPGRGPGNFGPGTFLAGPLMDLLDADKDKHLTRDEVSQGFGRWFDEWNTDKSGVLTDEQLREGINQMFMPRRGPFGGAAPGAPPR